MRIIYASILSLCILTAEAQMDTEILKSMNGDQYIQHLQEKMRKVENNLANTTEEYLNVLYKQESKIWKQISKIEPGISPKVLNDMKMEYDQMRKLFIHPATPVTRTIHSYLSLVDTIETSLNFMMSIKSYELKDKKVQEIKELVKDIKHIKMNIVNVDKIHLSINYRSEMLKIFTSKYGNLKSINKYEQTIRKYYSKVNEYKLLLNEPDKMICKTLEIIRNNKSFRRYFSNNSELSSIFLLPGSDESESDLTNLELQTRKLINVQLQQKFGRQSQIQSLVTNNLNQNQNVLEELKNRLNSKTGLKSDNNENLSLPAGQNNEDETGTKVKRFQPGFNFQTVKSNAYFPVTTDVAFSLGYKISKRNIIGIASSIKIGWGKDWSHIVMSNEGIGLRSYWDIRTIGSIWISASSEFNYYSNLKEFTALKIKSNWTRSALVGITKKYKVSGRVEGNIQLLYDFLWKNNSPNSQQYLFRVGYNFVN